GHRDRAGLDGRIPERVAGEADPAGGRDQGRVELVDLGVQGHLRGADVGARVGAPPGPAGPAIAPPPKASDPATLTALLRIRFTDVPFIVILCSAVLDNHPTPPVPHRLTAIMMVCPGLVG